MHFKLTHERVNTMKHLFLSTLIAIAVSVAGCSSVAKNFIDKPPVVKKMSDSKYHLTFTVEEESGGEAVFDKEAKARCSSGRYDIENFDREDVPMFYSIIRATIICK